MAIRHDVMAWIGFGLILGGVVWLGPLMFDQMTFFGDQAQEADAAAARALMPWPALLVAAGAGLIAMSARPLHGVIAALPLIAVALAWATPEALYQLLAYGIAAPAAAGSALAAILPRDAAPRPLAMAAVVIVAAGAILATPFLAGLAVLAFLAWWGLSSRPDEPAGHRR
jgi:hypothetical protein